MTQESLEKTLGIIRHTLTFAGGFFVTSGYITESLLSTGIGSLVALIGVVWSVIDKNKRA
jgi:hypothetical protein